jgi:hypothetical protein
MKLKMKTTSHSFIVLSLVVGAAGAGADEVFQASLTPDIAIYSKDTGIRGLVLDIWGENPQQGLALGFVNGSSSDSSGLSIGLVNYSESYTGVDWGFINLSRQAFVGWQNGLANYSQGSFTGLQSGWMNVAEDFNGLQVGVVNCAENLRGVQLGLANIAMNNSWFNEMPDQLATGFPFFNWSF